MLAREREDHAGLRKFVADNLREILALIEGLDPVKLEELQLETEDLADIDAYSIVARKLYEFGHYILNTSNL